MQCLRLCFESVRVGVAVAVAGVMSYMWPCIMHMYVFVCLYICMYV